MHSLGIHHVAVHARAAGVEAVAAFYRETVGLQELARHRNPDGSLRSIWLSLSTQGEEAAGFLAVEEGDSFGPAMIALRIDAASRGALLDRLIARAVAVQKQTQWTVYVDDPAGNHLGFSHHPQDPVA